ncbi:MAG: SRPBCC domain-containing protein [Bdellovibrionaceae bacterium]|nr:SRPBCC domain-containing protein [Pseudobdellovibrionaceae bacterium]
MSYSKITIETVVLADITEVWKFWTDPEHITKWNFASENWHCPKATNDLKIGGKYSARMEAKDGSFGFHLEATYDEVVDFKKLTYTMEDGRTAMTYFQPVAKGTNIKTVFDAEKENSVEMQKNGWQAILNNFKKYIEAST